MGDAGGELLEADVDEAVLGRLGLGHLAAGHLGHAGPLQLDGVEGPGDGQVVAQDDRVAGLLGGPPAAPLAPGGLPPEHRLDRAEVVGEVVLGQQVDEQAGPHLGGQAGLLGRPLVVGLEVPTTRIGDQGVGEPLLGLGQVPVEQPGGDGLELGEELGGVHQIVVHTGSLPTGR